MRTTLSLDDDVAALIARVRRERKLGLKALVNEALRQGLKQMTSRPPRQAAYHTKPVSLGRCLLGNLDDVADALAIAEGESFK